MEKLTKEDILREKKKIEEEREEHRQWSRKFEKQQEEEQWELQRQYHILDEMRMRAGTEDRQFLMLIEENQSRMNSLRLRKIELLDGMKDLLRRKNEEWGIRERDLTEQHRKLKETEESGEENL